MQFPPRYFIELNGNKCILSEGHWQNVSIVFSLLLFWSWCVRHFLNLIGLNKVHRLRARDAGISLCLSYTLPRRVTHGLYHIIRSKTRLCYSYSPGSYIPQRRDRPYHPSTSSVCWFSNLPEFASDRCFYAHRYHVDRQKSIRVLESFLSKKEQKVGEEAQWLREIKADCVLSDAAFLALCATSFFLVALGLR